jgi:hypothetical protein
MKRFSRFTAMLALCSGALCALPAQATPPDHAPAHGYRARHSDPYKYVYYPAQQVYYAPHSGNWFWLNGGDWQAGANLPAYFRASDRGGSIQVSLNTPQPYVQHVYVEEHYGKPWRAKHGYQHKHAHKHHDHYHKRKHRKHDDDD